MASGGHNAKPGGVLKLHGGYRKDRHAGRGPKSAGEPLQKPEGLGEHGDWLWELVTRTRAAWLSSSDAAALQELCEVWQYSRLCKIVLNELPTAKDARCGYIAYMGIFNGLAGRFGLTPSDRARLGEDKPERDKGREIEEMLG